MTNVLHPCLLCYEYKYAVSITPPTTHSSSQFGVWLFFSQTWFFLTKVKNNNKTHFNILLMFLYSIHLKNSFFTLLLYVYMFLLVWRPTEATPDPVVNAFFINLFSRCGTIYELRRRYHHTRQSEMGAFMVPLNKTLNGLMRFG